MKILIVCSKNSGKIAPFITEQVNALGEQGIKTDYFTIEQKGWKGYLNSRTLLLRKIKEFQPDIIHAHYGLSGLLANTQRKIPVITTYHGSDINDNTVFRFSKVSIILSVHNIFVSQKNIDKARVKKKISLIPCGVNTAFFYPQDKKACRAKLNLDTDKKYVLFAGAFDNNVKNPFLAKSAVSKLDNVELLELKGYSREEVVWLINAVDVCLMTSHTEGSPQFIKEAMACSCPIVSVDVGDVKEVIANTKQCYVCESYDAIEISEKLRLVFNSKERTNGTERISKLKLDTKNIAKKIVEIYSLILKKSK